MLCWPTPQKHGAAHHIHNCHKTPSSATHATATKHPPAPHTQLPHTHPCKCKATAHGPERTSCHNLVHQISQWAVRSEGFYCCTAPGRGAPHPRDCHKTPMHPPSLTPTTSNPSAKGDNKSKRGTESCYGHLCKRVRHQGHILHTRMPEVWQCPGHGGRTANT